MTEKPVLLSDPESAFPNVSYGHGRKAILECDRSDYFGGNVNIDLTEPVTIEAHVIVSHDCDIIRHDHDFGRDRTKLGTHSPLVIHEGAFIGSHVIILEGCRDIGAWSVIGAGSVVTRDVPAGVMVAGNPARQVGTVKEF